MNVKSMLARDILAATKAYEISFDAAKDEFVRRYHNGGPKAKRRAEANLVKLATLCDEDTPVVDDHYEKWQPSDLDILLDLHNRLGTWGAVYANCDMGPKRIADARGISAKSVSVAKSVYNRKNRESSPLSATDAAALLTLG